MALKDSVIHSDPENYEWSSRIHWSNVRVLLDQCARRPLRRELWHPRLDHGAQPCLGIVGDRLA